MDTMYQAVEVGESLISFTDPRVYVLDFERVKTLEDVIRILRAFNLHFYGEAADPIRDLVVEEIKS